MNVSQTLVFKIDLVLFATEIVPALTENATITLVGTDIVKQSLLVRTKHLESIAIAIACVGTVCAATECMETVVAKVPSANLGSGAETVTYRALAV